jgi:predicted phosphodiesterase
MECFTRRFFLGGCASFGALAGRRIFAVPNATLPKVNLRFGVVSDVHVRDDKDHDDKAFKQALTYFRDKGVDAVLIAGDIADRGRISQLQYAADAWYSVFPNDKAPDGRHVERLFVYGNHDWEGFKYGFGHIGKKLWPDKDEYARNILSTDQKANWERIFHEPFAPVYRKEVKGYTFIGGHWTADRCRGAEEIGIAGVEDFFAANAKTLDPAKPFFYFQHPHPKDTCYGSWAWGHDAGGATRALSPFPNAIAFSGHSHYSLTDERSIWQGAFTSLGTSSLRYTGLTSASHPPAGYENSSSPGSGRKTLDPYKVMRAYGTGYGRQGMLVRVYSDCVTFTRREFVGDRLLGDDWVLPLPAAEAKPFDFAARAAKSKAPQFPAGAALKVKKTRGKNRGLKDDKSPVPSQEKDIYSITFPAANAQAGARPFEYEVAIRPEGGKDIVRHVLAQGFNMPLCDKLAQGESSFQIAADQLPKAPFRFEVRPVSSLGLAGAPLVSEWIKQG